MSLPNLDAIVDLSEIPTAELVELLFEYRGQQRCAWLRTRLNQRIERRSGKRGFGGSQDRVLSNGSAKAVLEARG